jgi:hypothetical protein
MCGKIPSTGLGMHPLCSRRTQLAKGEESEIGSAMWTVGEVRWAQRTVQRGGGIDPTDTSPSPFQNRRLLMGGEWGLSLSRRPDGEHPTQMDMLNPDSPSDESFQLFTRKMF